tara:strand:+ start:7756 stop:8874 length:1119 start_codon:yes stop_codon:yes gene_type:complete
MKVLLSSFELSHLKTGVHFKIIGQAEGFKKLGYEVFYLFIDKKGLQLKNYKDSSIKSFGSVKSNIEVLTNGYKTAKKVLDFVNPEILYQRGSLHEPFFLSFLKYAKKKGARIFYEIPTYPYDNEFRNKKFPYNITKYIDKFYRNKLKKHVEQIVTYTNHQKIFNIPAIKIENGINTESFSAAIRPSNFEKLTLIGVANLSFWHAYDRLIEGLKIYYDDGNKFPVVFLIVGEGSEYLALKDKVKEQDLENIVTFSGRLTGEELNKVYNQKHLGVDLLGMFRRGFNECYSLKAREYCVRGIPFISSTDDSDFEEKFPFRFQIEPTESPIDVALVLNYYKVLHKKYSNEYQNELISFAAEKLSWEYKLKKVSNYF